VDDMNFNHKKGVSYLTEEQFELIEKLPEEIKLIMLGCDTEFFQNRRQSIEILERLAESKRDISVITKLPLSPEFIERLKEINSKLAQNGNLMAFSISLTGLKSAKFWEPRVPSPEKRIETLRSAHNAGIKSMVALRPLLPAVPVSELEDIIKQTKDYCVGYYSGPLYLKDLDDELLGDRSQLKIEELQPHWMPEGNKFHKIEKPGQMEELITLIENHGKPLFEGAADGINYIKSNEEPRT